MNEHAYSQDPEQAATTRRGFFKLTIAVVAFLNGLALGIPVVKTLISAPPKKKSEWNRISDVSSLPQDMPVEMKFAAKTEDAYHYATVPFSVWVIKHSTDKVTVFSPICPHLGCHFLWDPALKRFACPCHASVYSIDGKVLYGPAPRPLDPLPSKIVNGELFVRYERFKVGVSEKISL